LFCLSIGKSRGIPETSLTNLPVAIKTKIQTLTSYDCPILSLIEIQTRDCPQHSPLAFKHTELVVSMAYLTDKSCKIYDRNPSFVIFVQTGMQTGGNARRKDVKNTGTLIKCVVILKQSGSELYNSLRSIPASRGTLQKVPEIMSDFNKFK